MGLPLDYLSVLLCISVVNKGASITTETQRHAEKPKESVILKFRRYCETGPKGKLSVVGYLHAHPRGYFQ
jgi:hypothetical protein